jgi:hypothetical protein
VSDRVLVDMRDPLYPARPHTRNILNVFHGMSSRRAAVSVRELNLIRIYPTFLYRMFLHSCVLTTQSSPHYILSQASSMSDEPYDVDSERPTQTALGGLTVNEEDEVRCT